MNEQTNDFIKVTYGKGEAKKIIKKEKNGKMGGKKNKSERKYYIVQKSINVKDVTRKKQREKNILTRMKFDHTGLNTTLFIFS